MAPLGHHTSANLLNEKITPNFQLRNTPNSMMKYFTPNVNQQKLQQMKKKVHQTQSLNILHQISN